MTVTSGVELGDPARNHLFTKFKQQSSLGKTLSDALRDRQQALKEHRQSLKVRLIPRPHLLCIELLLACFYYGCLPSVCVELLLSCLFYGYLSSLCVELLLPCLFYGYLLSRAYSTSARCKPLSECRSSAHQGNPVHIHYTGRPTRYTASCLEQWMDSSVARSRILVCSADS